MSSSAAYGAVFAKTCGIFGKRLRADEFQKMAAMRSVPEVASFLRTHPLWGEALAGVDASSVTRDPLERLLRRFAISKYLTLFHFVGKEDRDFLRFPIITVETEQIMRFMRLASNGRPEEYAFDLPEYVAHHSKIDYKALSSAVTYDEMLAAVRETGFYESVRTIRPDDGAFPSYLLVETAMHRYFFRTLLTLGKNRGGENGALVRKSFAMQADWVNIQIVERAILYYPELLNEITHYLIPYGNKISPEQLHEMCGQPNADALRHYLTENTAYGRFIAQYRDQGLSLEHVSRLYQTHFYRRHLASASVFAPVALFELFHFEMFNLIHVVECVRYTLPPEKTLSYLVLQDN